MVVELVLTPEGGVDWNAEICIPGPANDRFQLVKWSFASAGRPRFELSAAPEAPQVAVALDNQLRVVDLVRRLHVSTAEITDAMRRSPILWAESGPTVEERLLSQDDELRELLCPSEGVELVRGYRSLAARPRVFGRRALLALPGGTLYVDESPSWVTSVGAGSLYLEASSGPEIVRVAGRPATPKRIAAAAGDRLTMETWNLAEARASIDDDTVVVLLTGAGLGEDASGRWLAAALSLTDSVPARLIASGHQERGELVAVTLLDDGGRVTSFQSSDPVTTAAPPTDSDDAAGSPVPAPAPPPRPGSARFGARLLSPTVRSAIEDAIADSDPAWQDHLRENLRFVQGGTDPLAVKYVDSKFAQSYKQVNAGLYIGSSNFTWGRGVYVTSIAEPLSTAMYGRIGVVSQFDPTGWRVFDARDPARSALYLDWLRGQAAYEDAVLTVHSDHWLHELRNQFREQFRIDVVLFHPDEWDIGYVYTRPTDTWMAVSDWTGSGHLLSGHSPRFHHARFAILIEDTFVPDTPAMSRTPQLTVNGSPHPSGSLPAQAAAAYFGQTIARVES